MGSAPASASVVAIPAAGHEAPFHIGEAQPTLDEVGQKTASIDCAICEAWPVVYFLKSSLHADRPAHVRPAWRSAGCICWCKGVLAWAGMGSGNTHGAHYSQRSFPGSQEPRLTRGVGFRLAARGIEPMEISSVASHRLESRPGAGGRCRTLRPWP
jgi:hypothetical protein